jgi:hypothetical protein
MAALAVSTLLRPYLGSVAGYAVWPMLVGLVAWTIAVVARLRLVGLLPSNADHFIPTALQPWIRFWLLARLGLLGAVVLLLLAAVAAALPGGPTRYCVEAFVYVVMARIFMDLFFGAVLNVSIITRRHTAG